MADLPPDFTTAQIVEAMRTDVRKLRTAFYGDPEMPRQKGAFDRLADLEEKLDELEDRLDKEEPQLLQDLKRDVEKLKLDLTVILVYLKGIIGIVATIAGSLIIAAIIAFVRFLSNIGGGVGGA